MTLPPSCCTIAGDRLDPAGQALRRCELRTPRPTTSTPIHALIARSPRERPPAAAHARGDRRPASRASSWAKHGGEVVGVRRARAAQRRTSPRCARSWSPSTREAWASAAASSTQLGGAPSARASRGCARSRTSRRTSSGSGFSIVPHLWLPEKIVHRLRGLPAVPHVRPVRDGRSPLDERQLRQTRLRCRRRRGARRVTVQPIIDGGITAAARLPRRRRQRRHQGVRRARPRAARRRTRRPRRRRVFTTNRSQAAPVDGVARAPRRHPAAARAPSSSTAAAPTPAPAPTACRWRARWRRETARARRLRARAGAGRLHRRHRRRA